MYSIIQFSQKDGGTVSIINSQWLTPRKCEVYWPPIKGTKAFDKILQNDATPDYEKWKLYSVQKVFYETDNIEKAKKKLRLVEDTSDLQTEEEDQNPKRRRTNKRYSISSEEESDKHARPPPLKKKFMSSIQDIRQAQPNDKTNEDTSLITERLADETKQLSPVQPAGSPQSQQLQNNSSLALSKCAQAGHSPSRAFGGRRLNFGGGASTSTSPSSLRFREFSNPDPSLDRGVTESPSCVAQLTGFQTRMIALLTVIKTQNEQIIEMLKHTDEAKQCTLKPEFKFPVINADALDTVESILKNKEHFDNLVSYIKKLGGRDISNKVSRVMKFIFTDQVAEQFNFYGKRSNKKPFYQLRLRDCVVDGVVATSSGATAKEVEDYIKIWLKHAPERLKKSKAVN